MEELVTVSTLLVGHNEDKDLIRMLQTRILARVNEITPGQAVILARCFMTEGSKNFMQGMDRIIGNGVFELSADLQADALQVFMSLDTSKGRDKICKLLFNSLSRQLGQLSDKGLLVMAEHANPSGEHGSFTIKQLELDQFIMRRVDGFLVDELFWAYTIFAKSDTELTDLYNAIENQFILNVEKMDLQVVIEYLYRATKAKEGSHRVISAFIDLLDT